MFAAAIKPNVPSSFVRAIEDAVLLGGIEEIDAVLESVGADESFPQDIRYALETLRYFRLYYGKNGECEPAGEKDKQTVTRLEMLWRQELIAMMGSYPETMETKCA